MRLNEIVCRKECFSLSEKDFIIFTKHANVNIIIPRNKTMVANRPEQCSLNDKVLNMQLFKRTNAITQYFKLYLPQFIYLLIC